MKRFLISLFVGLFGLVSFGYCATVSSLLPLESVSDFTVGTSWTLVLSLPSDFDGTYCLKFDNASTIGNADTTLQIGNSASSSDPTITSINTFYYFSNWYGNYVCSYTAGGWVYIYARAQNNSNNITLDYDSFVLNDLLDSDLPIFSSEDCQLQYNLIPVESIDTNYCVGNGLCPNSCGSGGDFSGDLQFSNLYVNDILFMPSSIYSLNIPEEFNFDYTGNENLLEIDVKGYNTDPDYIAGIISTQGNRPNNEFFNSIITDLIPKFVPGLVIILFIYFAFRFIKKVF